MARNTALAIFVVLLAASAAQAASIGGGTEGAGQGLPKNLQEQLNNIYNVIQELVAEIRANGTGLAPGARAYTWKQLDVLEDMWRSTSADVHAQMPEQMLVVRDVANVYYDDVQNELQCLTPEAKERAESLMNKLHELEGKLDAGSQAMAAALQASQQQEQPAQEQEQPAQEQEQPAQEEQQQQQEQTTKPVLPGLAGKVISAIDKLLPIHVTLG